MQRQSKAKTTETCMGKLNQEKIEKTTFVAVADLSAINKVKKLQGEKLPLLASRGLR
jgi:hypothetical protein